MEEDQKVFVEYPDNIGNHTTVISALRKKWEHETKNWQGGFFTNLENNGVAYSRFGKYILKAES